MSKTSYKKMLLKYIAYPRFKKRTSFNSQMDRLNLKQTRIESNPWSSFQKPWSHLSLMKSVSSLDDIWPCFMLWQRTSNPLFFSPCISKQNKNRQRKYLQLDLRIDGTESKPPGLLSWGRVLRAGLQSTTQWWSAALKGLGFNYQEFTSDQIM